MSLYVSHRFSRKSRAGRFVMPGERQSKPSSHRNPLSLLSTSLGRKKGASPRRAMVRSRPQSGLRLSPVRPPPRTAGEGGGARSCAEGEASSADRVTATEAGTWSPLRVLLMGKQRRFVPKTQSSQPPLESRTFYRRLHRPSPTRVPQKDPPWLWLREGRLGLRRAAAAAVPGTAGCTTFSVSHSWRPEA